MLSNEWGARRKELEGEAPGQTLGLQTCRSYTSCPKCVVEKHLRTQDVHSEFLHRNPFHC